MVAEQALFLYNFTSPRPTSTRQAEKAQKPSIPIGERRHAPFRAARSKSLAPVAREVNGKAFGLKIVRLGGCFGAFTCLFDPFAPQRS